MSKEALKLALEALKANYELINGSGNRFGLEGAMDGYYSGCFDVKGTNKKTNAAIKALEEALANQEQGEPAAKYIGEGNEGSLVQLYDDVKKGTDFYTTPQQRKPLTYEEIMGIARITCIGISPHEDTLNFVKAIEAAHGIKE
jgi:6-phosphogluconate dehydrogenase